MSKSRKRLKILKTVYFQPEDARKLESIAESKRIKVSDLIVSVVVTYLETTSEFAAKAILKEVKPTKMLVTPEEAGAMVNRSIEKFWE